MIEIKVNDEAWHYEIRNGWTYIYDVDGDQILYLNWEATEKEVLAAGEAYTQAMRVGIRIGRSQKAREIAQALAEGS